MAVDRRNSGFLLEAGTDKLLMEDDNGIYTLEEAVFYSPTPISRPQALQRAATR